MSKRVVRALLLMLLAVLFAAPLIAYGAYVQKQPVRHIVVFKYKPGGDP